MVTSSSKSSRPAWFVGADWDGQDQTARFVRAGVWENGYTDRYLDTVNSIREGDQIAIKSAYVRRNADGLPFNNRGHAVSVMAIKATGIVTRNMKDGRRLQVEWMRVDPPREWYFYTYRGTVWEVNPGTWATDQLIDFAFYDQPQDIDAFRNDPYWVQRFGDADGAAACDDHESPPSLEIEGSPSYSIESILSDGCFLPQSTLETILHRLRAKQNIILQGPPGAGKTWLSKRLAYALIGHKDDDKIRQVQFHPNLSYEDFVRGWRPQADRKLGLEDGPFLKLAEDARNDPDGKYVMVIEEINRGNPASIFGELLTLLEADKRNPDSALTLAYPRPDSERFHIPPNVYLIGTMNLADRSLALVDFALRRRFAFFDLHPMLNETWRNWVNENCGLPSYFLDEIAGRIGSLNDRVAGDPNLGPQFRIGHSHFTPPLGSTIDDPTQWFKDVVESEIAPLLREYWFDSPNTAETATVNLVAGL